MAEKKSRIGSNPLNWIKSTVHEETKNKVKNRKNNKKKSEPDGKAIKDEVLISVESSHQHEKDIRPSAEDEAGAPALRVDSGGLDFVVSGNEAMNKMDIAEKNVSHVDGVADGSVDMAQKAENLIIESVPVIPVKPTEGIERLGHWLIPVSAKTAKSLLQKLKDLVIWLDDEGEEYGLENIAYTLSVGRSQFSLRYAVVVSSIKELKEVIQKKIAKEPVSFGEKVKETSQYEEDGNHLVDSISTSAMKYSKIYRENLISLAQLYTNGYNPEWKMLFKGMEARRVPMPTYPFERGRYWVDADSKKSDAKKGDVERLHPMVERNTSSFYRQQFTTSLTGREPYIAVCHAGRSKCLLGLTQLEMARVACELAGEKLVWKIKDVSWSSPMYIHDNEVDISTCLYPTKDSISFEVKATNPAGAVKVLSQGSVVFSNNERKSKSERIDIEAIKRRCIGLNELIINDNLCGKIDTYSGINEVMGCLSILPGSLEKKSSISLNPSLTEAAVKVASKLASLNGEDAYLPYSMDELEIVNPLNEKCIVHVYAINDGVRNENNDICTVNMDFADEAGNVLVRIKGLCMKKFMSDFSGVDQAAKPLYLKSEWIKTELVNDGLGLGALSGSILVFDKDGTLSKALSDSLSRAGGSANVVTVMKGDEFRRQDEKTFYINPNSYMDYERLLVDLSKTGIIPQVIFHYWSSETFERNEQKIRTQLDESVFSVFRLTHAFMNAKFKANIELLYLHDIHEDCIQPVYAAVSGFAKTVNLENPNFKYKTIGISGIPSDYSEILIKELGNNGRDVEIKCSEGIRFVKRLIDADTSPIKEATNVLKENGTYLITGGTGGIGRIYAKYIAEKYKGRLVLTGRSEKGERVDNCIGKFEKLGVEAVYIKSDVSNNEEVEQLINTIHERFGKIDGVFHCAGIINDSYLINKTEEDFNNTISPKVFGTINLYNAVLKDQPGVFAMFSSTSAIRGNVGQSDYSYANLFMDNLALAEDKNSGSIQVISIDWPVWEEGSMKLTEEDAENLAKEIGFRMFPTNEGIKTWETVFKAGLSQCAVAFCDIQKGREYLCGTAAGKGIGKEALKIDIEPEIIINKTEKYLMEVFSGVFKLPIEKLDLSTYFQDYGIDSIAVKHFNTKMEKNFSSISKTLLYEYRNIGELAQYMFENHNAELLSILGLVDEKPETQQAPNANISWGELKSFEDTLGKGVKSLKAQNNEDIAIIGINARFPMAEDANKFWENLRDGKDCVSVIPETRWDWRQYFDPDPQKAHEGKIYSKWGGFLEDADKFDPLFFNISPKEAELMDPQERLLLESTWTVLEDAGYNKKRLQKYVKNDRSAEIGVFSGVTTMTYLLLARDEWRKGNMAIPNSMEWSMANRLSYVLNFNGPSMPVDTACSSGLVAVHLACQSLKNGECGMAVVGGVNLYLHPIRYIGLCQMRMLSPTGRCHAFGADGDGFIPGEGVGSILLKPLSEAEKDGDYIYGVIKATSINHGGNTSGYTVPNPNAHASLIGEALSNAGMDARTISYIEAHGTGTSLGDPIEIKGLTKAFRNYTKENQFCSIGSVKTNIGHLESGAGIASIIKVLLQMKYKKLVPSLFSERKNTNIDFEGTPFYVQQKLEDWEQPIVIEDGMQKIFPRRAGISSFGAGGTNAHVIIEEYSKDEILGETPQNESFLYVISAKDEERLLEYAEKLVKFIDLKKAIGESIHPSDLAYTMQVGRDEMEERLAVIAKDLDELRTTLIQFCKNGKILGNLLYRGNVRSGREEAKKYQNSDISPNNIVQAIEEKNMVKLAQMWVNGADINWKPIYGERIPKVIPAPTYPFSHERYWIPKTYENQETSMELGHGKIHPLLGQNTSTLKEQRFTTCFTGKEFFLADHVVNGNKILPGVAYIEMARVAARISSEESSIRISNIFWARPLAVNNSSVNVNISLFPNDDELLYEVATIENDNTRLVHSQGKVEFGNNKIDDNRISIIEVQKRCTEEITGEVLYSSFEQDGYVYGRSLRSITSLRFSKNEALARLELPEGLENGFSEFGLHPALMDGAFQSVAGILSGHKSNIERYMPFALGGLSIHGILPKRCWAYVALKENRILQSSDIKKFNIRIIDDDGRVLVLMDDFSAKPLRKSTVNKYNILEVFRKLQVGELDIDEVEQLIGGIGV